jgi:hypothetical protein
MERDEKICIFSKNKTKIIITETNECETFCRLRQRGREMTAYTAKVWTDAPNLNSLALGIVTSEHKWCERVCVFK